VSIENSIRGILSPEQLPEAEYKMSAKRVTKLDLSYTVTPSEVKQYKVFRV